MPCQTWCGPPPDNSQGTVQKKEEENLTAHQRIFLKTVISVPIKDFFYILE